MVLDHFERELELNGARQGLTQSTDISQLETSPLVEWWA